MPYFYIHLLCMLVARSAVMLDAALALVVFSFAKSQQETPLSAVKCQRVVECKMKESGSSV
jgi:hypothetical protein